MNVLNLFVSTNDVTVGYTLQDINDIPAEFPECCTKPWRTGQAVLAGKKVIVTF